MGLECLRPALQIAGAVVLVFGAIPGTQAATLWSNGAVNSTLSADNRCDSGPNLCGSVAPLTIFDNFNIPSGSKSWIVTGVTFTDFLVNVTGTDIGNTQWSVWSGDPLVGGKLVASGSIKASASLVSGTCGPTGTCLETFTLNFASPVVLSAGNTYYLGTSTTVSPTNANESLLRAFAAGGNTAPGGTVNSLADWEQSNGSTNGVVNSGWAAGTINNTFSNLAPPESATAFDIQGELVPEPGTLTLLGSALASLAWLLRRRRA